MKLRKNSTRTYTAYAEIYDAYKGDRSENIARLEGLIKKYRPSATTVLDLACGTGAIAAGLMGKYLITGVDNSPAMLRIAQAKLPQVRFLQADMTNFVLDHKFDAVYCLHNSMNHLITFSTWGDTFKHVAAALNKGGVFIFDFNPLEKLEAMTSWGLGAVQVGDDYVMTSVVKDAHKQNHYHWNVKVMTHQRKDNYVLEHEKIAVTAYPFEQIDKALSKYFTVTEFFVIDQAAKHEDIGRAYYICTKKPAQA